MILWNFDDTQIILSFTSTSRSVAGEYLPEESNFRGQSKLPASAKSRVHFYNLALSRKCTLKNIRITSSKSCRMHF